MSGPVVSKGHEMSLEEHIDTLTTSTAIPAGKVEPTAEELYAALPEKDQRAIDALEKCIVTPPENSRIFTFTPGMSKYFVKKYNLANRPKKPAKIKQFATDMDEGRWGLTGDTLKWSNSGILLDGQNRLFGCIEADTDFRTHVVFGIDSDLFVFMDRGKNRDGSDALAVKGVTNSGIVAAGIRWAELIDLGAVKGRATFLPYEILDLYENKHQKVEDWVTLAKKTAQPAGMMAAILYHCGKADHKDALDFAQGWASGQRQKPFQAIAKAESRIMEISTASSGRVHDVVRAAIITIAWNQYRANKAGRVKDFLWDLSMSFPKIN